MVQSWSTIRGWVQFTSQVAAFHLEGEACPEGVAHEPTS
jgi:hypothetical protein